MRLALIGCGKRLRDSLLPTLAKTPGLRVAALVDPRQDAANQIRTRLRSLGVRVDEREPFLPADDRLAPADVDAVIVASPHAFHEHQARRWLGYGKPVFIEKPLACRHPQAADLVHRGRAVGLTVSDPRRFRPDLAALARLLRSGAIGRLRSVRYEDFVRVATDLDQSWRSDPRLAGGGVLLDLGCHTLGAILRICAPRDVEVERVHLRSGPHRVETEAHLWLRLGSVAEAEIRIGLAGERANGWEDLTLWGDTGRIRLTRVRGTEALANVEVSAGNASQRLRLFLGSRSDGEGLRRFLLRPRSFDAGSLHRHLEVLRLISQTYEKVQLARPHFAQGWSV
jgi:predicted dehydrogenase